MSVVVIGGGEHARVVMEAVLSRDPRWPPLAGFVDPAACEETCRRLGVKRLGDDSEGLRLVGVRFHFFVLGIGTVGVNSWRRTIVERYGEARWTAVVHDRATVSASAQVHPGAVVMAGAVVNSGAQIGAHAVINTGAIVEHDVQIGEFAQVGPAAALGGGVRIGEGSYVGLGARVRDHVIVGAGSLVGMGAVVVGDVAPGQRVLGVPARVVAPREGRP